MSLDRLEREVVVLPPPPRVPRRRRIVALVVLAAVIALAVGAVLVLSASGDEPPATGAAQVVPAGALAYVHLSTDPGRPAVKAVRALAARFPDFPLLYAATVNRFVGGLDMGSWLGKEAALALFGGARGAGSSGASLVVLDVRNHTRARASVAAAGAAPLGAYRGIALLRYRSGNELAFVRHYLVIGPDAEVRAAIDASTRRAASLARDPRYRRAVAGEPVDRVVDVYLTPAGVRGLLLPRPGVLAALGTLLDRPALTATTISVSPAAHGARLQIHSILDARQMRRGSSRPASFVPTLQSFLPAGSALMLDVQDLTRAAPELLRAMGAARFGAGIAPLLARLGAGLAAQGVSVARLLSIFRGETAVAIGPSGSRGASPSLIVLARVPDQTATEQELALAEPALAALFPPPGAGPGQSPELAQQQVGGVTIDELGLGPGLQVDYAAFDGIVALSTSLRAIDAVVGRGRSLAGEREYRSALASRPRRVSSLLFLDWGQLLSLAEQIGLIKSTRVREVTRDIAKVRTVGLDSTRGENDTITELYLSIP